MKIAFCSHKFMPPFVGGVDVYTERLSQALKQLGHEILILAFDSTADVDSSAVNTSFDYYNGIKVWRLQFSLNQRPKEAFDYCYDPEVGTIIKNILLEQQPDLLIIMNFYTITLAVVEVAKDLGIGVVHVVTDFLPICRRATFIRWDNKSCQIGETVKSCAACFVSNDTLGRLAALILNRISEDALIKWSHTLAFNSLYPFQLLNPYWKQVAIMTQRLRIIEPIRKKIDLVLAPNQYIMQAYLANGFRSDQIRFLPFGVDPEHPLSKLKRVPAPYTRFLFIGRFQPYKGAHLLIEAFNNLQAPKNATLTIYGVIDAHYSAYFKRLKTMMMSNNRIRFAGQIAPTDLSNAFAEADFFVLPSTWHENSPLIVLDALQSKTPVITSNIGGVTDIVKDHVNGLLFRMGDKYALQQVMQRVIDQPNLAVQLNSGIDLPSIENYARVVIEQFENSLTRIK